MNNVDGFTLTQTGDHTAHLSGIAPSTVKKTTITIIASNSEGKVKTKVVIQTTKPVSAIPESQISYDDNVTTTVHVIEKRESESITTTTQQTSEAPIELGGTNTTLNLEDYTIIATLPAISVDFEGMYDFSVELDENVEPGEKLYWFANPKDKEPSDDDEIAEFYDVDGKEITTIPEDRAINISAWLNPGGYYEPIIAIKPEE